jgi:hypothetical protein
MAQITASDSPDLRSAVPVTVAVLALLGVLLAGAFALRGLVGFGVWFLGAG